MYLHGSVCWSTLTSRISWCLLSLLYCVSGVQDIHQIKSRGNIPDASRSHPSPKSTCRLSIRFAVQVLERQQEPPQKAQGPQAKVKKLKYHQYTPPDQKAEKSPPPMDSAYARLLQQQQLFLQLQILSQQQPCLQLPRAARSSAQVRSGKPGGYGGSTWGWRLAAASPSEDPASPTPYHILVVRVAQSSSHHQDTSLTPAGLGGGSRSSTQF